MATPLDRLLSQLRSDIDEIIDEAKRGRIDARTFYSLMEETLVEHHVAAALVAAERTRVSDLAPETLARLEQVLDFHLDRADRFSNTIAADGWQDGHAARAHLYEGSIKTSYGLGKGDIPDIGQVALPVYPGEGSPCITNCRCQWERETVDATMGHYNFRWTLGDAEHCSTCEERAAMWNPLQVRFGEVVA